jgi:ATP-dependent Lon protease
MQAAGLDQGTVGFTQDAVRKIIREYTREAGLRNLQRQIASLCRKIARNKLNREFTGDKSCITPERVEALLGPKKFYTEVTQAKDRIGVATGLAWTDTGGEIIFIEATKMRGRNRLILTGSLGNVMKESAQAALSYIRSHTGDYQIPEDFFEKHDIHVHVPAGAIPKDGPSAGLTIAVALLSLITDRPCRRDTALTGELTLTGRILPVGGVKEKLLAAHRAGIKRVVFPIKNEANLRKIPAEIQNDLEITTIDELHEVVAQVLKQNPV